MTKVKVVLFLLLAAFATSSFAESVEDQREERQKIFKNSKNKNKDKALKLADEEFDKLLEEGWKSMPDVLPIERQIDAMHIMQMEYDSNLFPVYIMAEARSVNQDYEAAKKRAMELAKPVLVTKIQSEVIAQIQWAMNNEVLEQREGEYIIKIVNAAKDRILQNLEKVMPVVEICRIPPSKSKEVRLVIACVGDLAKKKVKKAIKADLDRESEKLQKKLAEILGW
ncbi:MAG: hypothetical protein Q4B61_12780 [Bacteroidales bacterium]|nr:hypothetical protein [Bacteroidales bacterium]